MLLIEKLREVIFEAILGPSERYKNILDNPEYNSVLPFRKILKIFAMNMLCKEQIDKGKMSKRI